MTAVLPLIPTGSVYADCKKKLPKGRYKKIHLSVMRMRCDKSPLRAWSNNPLHLTTLFGIKIPWVSQATVGRGVLFMKSLRALYPRSRDCSPCDRVT